MTVTDLFHYTTGHKLIPIQQSGVLLPTSVAVAPQERPVLWFSAHPVYEPTAIKLIMQQSRAVRPTFQELHELIGLFRFRLPANDKRLIPFSKLPRIARISSRDVASMVASGLRIGATPTHWYGVMSAVPLSELSFESWTGNDWVPASLAEAVGMVRSSGPRVQSISAAHAGVPVGY